MRGVSIPSHQYALSANDWLESKWHGDEDKFISVQKALLASSCRAYTRVVLRLRAQAEEDQAARMEGGQNAVYELTPPQSTTSVNASRRDLSRAALSRPTSPTSSAGHSLFSSSTTHLAHGHNHHGHGHGRGNGSDYPPPSSASTRRPPSAYDNRTARNFPPRASPKFRSPLFKIGHAPLLRVYVPSPEGEWLSDESVMDCEKELKRAGVLPLLRVGDVVWDAAVGDEGNVGRMIWDGNYLIVSWLSLMSLIDGEMPYLYTDPTLYAMSSHITGPGLYILAHWRASSVLTYTVVPAVIFPPRHPNAGEPYRLHGPLAVGRGDCGKSAVVAGQDSDGDVSTAFAACFG